MPPATDLASLTKRQALIFFYKKWRKEGIDIETAKMQSKLDMNQWAKAIETAAQDGISLKKAVLRSMEKSWRLHLMHRYGDWSYQLVNAGWRE